MIKTLVVTVDTEEEGLWGGNYPTLGNTTENLRGLPRFQAECERLAVPPTYLIDAPVLDDARAMSDLSRWQRAGTCEVGTHCHPWCNPPLDSRPPTSAETYLCNLPVDLQRAKLQWLTNRIADQTGRSPTSYRAGRYGFDHSSATILEELGYEVDSSELPMFDYRDAGGPDFRMADRLPRRYFGDRGKLIEIPVTAGFTRPGYRWRRAVWIQTRRTPSTLLRAAGIADRMDIARRVKLSPEGMSLKDLKSLIDACVTDGISLFVLMLHSSSLQAGFSPYAKNEAMLTQLYERLVGAIQHATERHHCEPKTLTEASRVV